jgi:hypothetical protein
MLVRRMNEMRRSARAEITTLKDQVQSLSTASAGTSKPGPETTAADLKIQLNQLKEDNNRKSKLIATLKSTKVAEETTVEQWKFEAGQLDETVKR